MCGHRGDCHDTHEPCREEWEAPQLPLGLARLAPVPCADRPPLCHWSRRAVAPVPFWLESARLAELWSLRDCLMPLNLTADDDVVDDALGRAPRDGIPSHTPDGVVGRGGRSSGSRCFAPPLEELVRDALQPPRVFRREHVHLARLAAEVERAAAALRELAAGLHRPRDAVVVPAVVHSASAVDVTGPPRL